LSAVTNLSSRLRLHSYDTQSPIAVFAFHIFNQHGCERSGVLTEDDGTEWQIHLERSEWETEHIFRTIKKRTIAGMY
jgi:hypothetical protein